MPAARNAALPVLAVLLVAACCFAWTWREPDGSPSAAHAAPAQNSAATDNEGLTASADQPVSQVTAAFIGDSYTAGFGASEPVANFRWTHLVADRMGWSEVNLGRGGTGYRTVADSAGCGLDFCPSYIGMLPELAASSPDVVFISGGRNDDTADIEREADQLFHNVAVRFPDAQKYVTSPVWDAGPAPGFMARQTTILQQSAEKHGFVFLHIGQPLAGNTEMISGDGLHPNDRGHEAIADAVVGALIGPAAAPAP